MAAYYNEHDKKAAAWIRELMKEGLIAPGDVDERSIEDVTPNEIRGYTQCHFFAGVAVWSYSLRRAGWPDDRPVWTGSCPCQPFSSAGKGEGFDDERHLWPAWFHLIDQLRPFPIFGEQVSSKDGLAWLDLVSDDLESADYSLRAVDIPACSVGAPHRRNRFYFVADSLLDESRVWTRNDGEAIGVSEIQRTEHSSFIPSGNGSTSILSLPPTLGRRGRSDGDTTGNGGEVQVEGRGTSCDLDDANGRRCEQLDADERNFQEPDAGCSPFELGNPVEQGLERLSGNEYDRDESRRITADEIRSTSETGPTNGFWAEADWIKCTDTDPATGKHRWRAVEPGSFPLVNGTPGRVGLLRGYGNAIVAPLAEEFIKSYLDTKEG